MLRNALVITAASLSLAGCGGGSLFSSGATSSSGSSPSFGDRFSQLFGSNSQAPGQTAPPDPTGDLTCPSVSIRPGASTFAMGAQGKPAVGNDLAYQATITRTARSCDLVNGQVNVKLGVQGRIIVGPAGAPETVQVPLRIAVVQEGVNPKTVATKVFTTTVSLNGQGNVEYSLVGEDFGYPAPTPDANDSYVFYIGFDPQALKPQAPVRKRR
ncbi:hypothetical protein RPMA_03280 [Tardiphaga alba]|uniref:Lipoprotein n=2 Tax=Tardiphaga alba TaxID=340268 RepID=A0ABX8AES7_9BRAD|nr:hypothetical protein RPMA_03280 [Tardiphaga alba]